MIGGLEQLPKIELHLHLDCSLSPDVVRALSGELSMEEYRRRFVAPDDATGLPDYLERALEGIRLMQAPEQIRLVTLDLFEQLKADHVLYAEIRFAPLEHTQQGLSPKAVVNIVESAILEGMQATGILALAFAPKVVAKLIRRAFKHLSPKLALPNSNFAHSIKPPLVK